MIIIFIDLTGSTAEMESRGGSVSIEFINRLNSIKDSFIRVDSTLYQVGLLMGDGLLLVSKAHEKLANLVLEAIQIQQQFRGLDVAPKIVFAIGDPIWQRQTTNLPGIKGEEFTEKSSIYGVVVNLAARLLSICPPNGIIMSEGAHALLVEYPDIVNKFQYGSSYLRGFKQKQPYWVINIRSKEDLSMNGEDLQELRKELYEIKIELTKLCANVKHIAEFVPQMVTKMEFKPFRYMLTAIGVITILITIVHIMAYK